MNEVWLEFCFSDSGVFISDWTHHMIFIKEQIRVAPVSGQYPSFTRERWKQEYWRYQSEFTTITGKAQTYHVKAYGKSHDEIKSLAIWYHVNKANGNFRKYRLD